MWCGKELPGGRVVPGEVMFADQAAVAGQSAECDLAAIGVVPVPEVWPPLDPAHAARAFPRAAAGGGPVQPPDPEDPWPQQFAGLLGEALTGARPVQQGLPWLSRRGSVQPP